jgi:hypothetical protein
MNYVEFITEKTTLIPLLNNGKYDFYNKNVVLPLRVNLNDAKINKIIFKYLKNINKLLCLDFHGVTDLFLSDEKIPNNLNKCIISYIHGTRLFLICFSKLKRRTN